MKSQPNRDYVSNDDVMTPRPLAKAIVEHFRPSGICLDPCRGEGAFFDCLPDDSLWFEVKEGRDFLTGTFPYGDGVNWIVSNPPWSQIRPFLARSMSVSDNVVFLLTVNHIWTKARIRDIRAAGFGIKEILLCDMPREFPQSGFQLGAVHLARGWTGPIALSQLPKAP